MKNMTTQTLEKIETAITDLPVRREEVLSQNSDTSGLMRLLEMAIANKADIDTLERLMKLKKEYEAAEAKKAFDEAMAEFQGECPIIKKDRAGGKTSSGVIAYKYAPLDAIVSQTKKIIQKHGFSFMILEEEDEKGRDYVFCVVKHKLGHSEKSRRKVVLGTKTGVMSDTQVYAAALTFSKRNAFTNAFGIITGDDDNEDMLKDKTGKTKTAEPAMARTVERGGVGEYGEIYKLLKELNPAGKTHKQMADFVNKIAGTNIETIARLTVGEGRLILARLLEAKAKKANAAEPEILDAVNYD